MLIRDNLCRQLKPWIENSLKKDDGENIDDHEEPSIVKWQGALSLSMSYICSYDNTNSDEMED